MKEVTLSTERVVKISPLKVKQLRRMDELVGQGKAMEATVGANVDAMNNAGDPITVDAFEEDYTIPEVNELFQQVAEISQIKLGEAKANA
jgi:hypothetical protein